MIDVGLYFFPTDAGPEITAVARAAEDHGLESLFVPEHSHIPATPTAFLGPDGKQLPERYRRIHDPFVALAAAAAVTTRLRIGTAACVVTQREVIVTAKAVATLDRLSRGRLVFGVGAGWNVEELRSHGVDPSTRFSLFAEAIEAMSRIWVDDEAEFHGEHISFGPIWSWPKPSQTPRPPVLVAGNSMASIKRAVAFGDGWLPTHRGTHDLTARVKELRLLAESTGRPQPSVTFIASEPSARAIEACLSAGANRVLLPISTGEPEEVLPTIERCADARAQVAG